MRAITLFHAACLLLLALPFSGTARAQEAYQWTNTENTTILPGMETGADTGTEAGTETGAKNAPATLPTPPYIIPTRRIGAAADTQGGRTHKYRWARPGRAAGPPPANPLAPDNGVPAPDRQMLIDTAED